MTFTDTNTDAYIAEKWHTLPQQLKDAITAADYRDVVQRFATEQKLHVDQAGAIEQEILLVLLGIQSVHDFTDALVHEVHLPKDLARSFSGDVQTKVFGAVAGHLRDIMEQEKARAEAAEEAAQQNAAPALEAPKHIDPYREPID